MDLVDYEELTEWKIDKERVIERYARQNGITSGIRKKARNAIQTILLNISNGMPFEEAAGEAASFISNHTKIEYDTVLNLLHQKANRKRRNGFRRIFYRSGITLTPEKFAWFKSFPESDVRDLDARYGFIPPSSAFFWSIHPDLYEVLHPYDPIEGFASPFNFNCERWCSRYEEDKIFGSLGNFFTVIQQENAPQTLWVINPPYTIFLFNEVLKYVILRREMYPEDDFLFLLPGWDKLKIREYIQLHGTIRDLDRGTYKIFDFSTNQDVIPPAKMSLGYIGHRLCIDVLADKIITPQSKVIDPISVNVLSTESNE